MRSMTGYGAAEYADDKVRLAVEVRAVNNRFLKLNQRTSDGLGAMEVVVERLVRDHISRGMVNVSVTVEPQGSAARAPVNTDVLAAYWDDLKAVRHRLGAETAPVSVEALLALPGVVGDETVLVTGIEGLPGRIEAATREALDHLDRMRAAEGDAMARDMASILAGIRRRIDAIQKRAPAVVDEYRARLGQRLKELLDGAEVPVDDQTFVREIAFFAERSDINEELARLTSHVDQFEELLASPEPVGRKFEFLTQEMYREINTIGAKANDPTISRDVVEAKVGVDRLREHSQNIE